MKTNIILLSAVALVGLTCWASIQTHRLSNEVVIDAPPERVWRVLTDTAAYPQWNPVIVRLQGDLVLGRSIEFENRSATGRVMVFRPTILKADAARELRWLGRLWLPRLFDGEHYFVLTPVGRGQTRLEHGENFSGALIPFTRNWLRGPVLDDFARLNMALKARAEAGS